MADTTEKHSIQFARMLCFIMMLFTSTCLEVC